MLEFSVFSLYGSSQFINSIFNSTFILIGCCRLCNNRRNHRTIFSLQIMLRTILAYPSLWCYEWNRLVGWVGLVIKTTGCSRSTIWISERWINLVIKTQEIKMQFKEVIMYSNAHIWIKYGLKDNTKKLCQSSNNLIKKRICVI